MPSMPARPAAPTKEPAAGAPAKRAKPKRAPAKRSKPKPRSAPATPSVPQKRQLTLREAELQIVRAAAKASEAKAERAEADPVLLEYFERTGRETGPAKLVGWTWSGGAEILDQPKVRAFLGTKIKDFLTRTRRVRSIRVLGKGGRV